MTDRPWEMAEAAKTQITHSRLVEDPIVKAAGQSDVTVEFGVPATMPWEVERRLIRSALALDGDGVYEMSVRLPEVTLEIGDWKTQQLLEDATETALEESSFPDMGGTRVRGGQHGFAPHVFWSGRPGMRYYGYADEDNHRVAARQSVRMVEDAIKTYRKEVRADR